MAISVSQAFKDAFKGPVDRTLFKVEVYFSASLGWVDVTSYVEAMNGTMEEVSSLTGGASANTLSLVLNNDDGRFSRKNTASPYYAAGLGMVPNRPIRVSAVYSSESVRKFTGYTGPWNTNAKTRTCTVSAQDAARLLRTTEVAEEVMLDPANPSTGYYLTRVIERAAWLAGLRWEAVTTKATAWTDTTHGGTITPTYDAGATRAVYTQGGALVMTLDLVDLLLPVAHLKGKALELIAKLAEVVDGKVYFDGQGQLVFRARMYRNDSAVSSSETFTVSSLEDVTAQANFEASEYAPLVNKATMTGAPLAPWLDTSGAWSEQEVVIKDFVKASFTASETYPGASDPSLFLAIPDGYRLHRTTSPAYPTAASVSIRSVDPDDLTRDLNGITLSGSPSFFPGAVKATFVNNGSGTEQLAEVKIRAKFFQAKQGVLGSAENADSQALYGQRAIEVENNFIPTVAAAKQLAAFRVEDGRQVKDCLTLPVMFGVPWLELNDRITVSETITNSLPAAEEFIVKRINWALALAGYTFVIEACTPSPTFSVGSLPATATITETANVNLSAAVKGGLPPQAIDGTQALVGLNNVPAFYGYTNGVKKLTWSDVYRVRGIGFDGSDLLVATENYINTSGLLYKVDSMTGASLGSLAASTSGLTNGVFSGKQTISGKYLFALYTDTSAFEYYVLGVDLTSFSTFAIKAKLGGSTRIPEDIMAVGGKLYVVTRSAAVGSEETRLHVWDAINLTRQDAADDTYEVWDDQSEASLAFDGRYLAIAVDADSRVDRFDTQTDTLTADWITLDSGEEARGIVTDGRSWFVNSSKRSWTSDDPRIIRFYPTPSGMQRDPREYGPITGSQGGPIAFDGTYIWTVIDESIVQLTTGLDVIAEFPTGGDVPGPLVFDGSAIWAGLDDKAGRVNRLVSGRQF